MSIEQIIKICDTLEVPFVDVDFPPRAKSLKSDAENDSNYTITWRRYFSQKGTQEAILAKKPIERKKRKKDTLGVKNAKLSADGKFATKIIPSKLFPSLYSNHISEILSGLSRSFIKKKLFHNHIPNKWGVYCVTLHLGDRKRRTDVIVDDVFPCGSNDLEILTTSCSDFESPWASIVEKALAKAHGSYSELCRIPLETLLCEVLGVPITTIRTTTLTPSELCDIITKAAEGDTNLIYCITAPNEIVPSAGLLVYHVRRAEIVRVGSSDVMLINLWTPQQAPVIGGEWLVGSKNWALLDEETQKSLLENDDDDVSDDAINDVTKDGTSCWVSPDELLRYCLSVYVPHMDGKWTFKNVKGKLLSDKTLLSITVERPCEAIVTVAQEGQNSRGVRMCLATEDPPYTPMGGTKELFVSGIDLSTSKIKLLPGKYSVLTEVYNKHVSMLPADVTFTVAATPIESEEQEDEKTDDVSESEKTKKKKSKRKGGGSDWIQLGDVKDGKGMEWDFMIPDMAERFGSCSKCGNPLSGQLFTIQDKKFHKYCFVCNKCGVRLGTSVLIVNGDFYCADCVDKMRAGL